MSGLSQFDERSDSLRQEVLVPSGGWLGEVVVLISELCGIWDIFVLMTFFVVAWVVIRTTSCEVSVVLGLIFDLSIPLQYQNNEALGKRHDQHLRDYWPIFTMGSLVVGATYFLAYGELFTLVVCVKTTICLVVWLSKRPDGSKVQLSSGSGSSTASRSSSQPPSSRSRSSTADSPPATPRSSSRGYKPSSKMPVDARFPDADKRLFEAGYTDAECREGMIRHMLGESKQANAEKNLKRWIKTAKEPGMIAKKTEQYRKEAALRRPLQQGTSGSGGAGRSSGSGGSGGSSGSGRGGSGPPPGKVMLLPTAQLEAIEKALKRSKYSKQTDKIMKSIVAAKTPDELKEIIKEWNLLAMNVPPEALRPRDNLTGKLSSSWVKDVRRILVNADDGLGVPPDVAEEMVKHLYAQPDEATAEALVKQWATLAAAPRGKQRTAAIAAMMKPYAERVVDLKYGKIWRSE